MNDYDKIKQQWEKRRERMRKLYHDEKWTMKEIGAKYGVTIERVRVIVGPRHPRKTIGHNNDANEPRRHET